MILVHLITLAFISVFFILLILHFFYVEFFSYYIFNAELIVNGLALLLVTMRFNKLTKELFQDDFSEEKGYFRLCLIIFLGSITIRILTLAAVVIRLDGYVRWW
jgi:hypothetical protein